MGTSPKHLDSMKRWGEEQSKKIRSSYELDPKRCKKCSGPIPWDKRSRLYCSDECLRTSGTRGGGRNFKPRSPCSNPGCTKPVSGVKGKYCSSQCSGEHRSIQARDKWLLEGEEPGSGTIRRHLKSIRDECWCCGITEWNNKPIVLEIEHKDGNGHNNDPSNLELLCPNCHSQTDTWKARNMGNGRVARRERAREDYRRSSQKT